MPVPFPIADFPARGETERHPDDALFYDRFPKDRAGASILGTYTRGGTVVTCGATDWAHGLVGKDPAAERITKHVLDRLGK